MVPNQRPLSLLIILVLVFSFSTAFTGTLRINGTNGSLFPSKATQQSVETKSSNKTMSNKGLQSAAGAMWLMTGCMLMARGGRYFWQALHAGDATGRTITLALTLGLFGGLAKGRFVLAKTALRNKRRLQKLNQASPWQIFAPGFYPLMVVMMGMSIGLKKLFGTGFAGGMVTYGGIVTGIGTGLFVSSFAYWFESWFGQLAQKDLEDIDDAV